MVHPATGARLEFDLVDVKPNNSGRCGWMVNTPLKEVSKFASRSVMRPSPVRLDYAVGP